MVFVVNIRREGLVDYGSIERFVKDFPVPPRPEYGIHNVIK